MTQYSSTSEVLRSSLYEYLSASKLALDFKKPQDWGDETGHCLGFAAALLLFCVVDAIGAHYRRGQETFLIGGKQRQIRRADFQHFFVLNSPELYGQSLAHDEIKHLYDNFRSTLAHAGTPNANCPLIVDPANASLFPLVAGQLSVNLPQFHNRSVEAVAQFLATCNVSVSEATQQMLLRR